jgi:hypothetical protein
MIDPACSNIARTGTHMASAARAERRGPALAAHDRPGRITVRRLS